MKKALVILTTMTLSAGAWASIGTTEHETTLTTHAYASEQQAYDAGFAKVDALKKMPSNELANALNVYDAKLVQNTLKVSDAEVKVESFAKQDGQVQYRAVVDVDYQYTVREGKNS
ncbi:DUF3316 domain-containing protein [Vibrio sp. Vb2880]|uniref:DUF3316 domain-containing protein n=1 Tax=Vibrio TaxID=662 RepID=UPI00117EDB4C|nr:MULTISPECIES: DUF3316 domain-containing protein [Vibrio]MBO0213516.1 DUF3316 domain-containing protein [Vibrio sp. Vb2880]TRN24850.1 acyl-CoA synthetase [Vibrio furnissii]WHR52948.1 DUF3316 domain-containing protein [Vibrio furnissii]WJG28004.1 DUF3316 domain-containing protein [Vibrio furnissii]